MSVNINTDPNSFKNWDSASRHVYAVLHLLNSKGVVNINNNPNNFKNWQDSTKHIFAILNELASFEINQDPNNFSNWKDAVVAIYSILNELATVPSFTNRFSLNFDGMDDFVNSGASTLSGETALSISAWIYPTAYGDATAPSFVSTDEASPRAFYLSLYNGTNFRFSMSTNGTNLNSLDTAIGTVTLNAWQHILVTWDKVNTNFYKNGLLLKTVATTFANNQDFTTTNDLLIGARRSSAGFFEGNIDEVAIFNSVVDIADVWNGTGEATDLSAYTPVSWWRNGDPNGQASYPTITDDGSASNDGTMTNMIATDIETDVP